MREGSLRESGPWERKTPWLRITYITDGYPLSLTVVVLSTGLCGPWVKRVFFPGSVTYLSILHPSYSFPFVTTRRALTSPWTPLTFKSSRPTHTVRRRHGREGGSNLDGLQSFLRGSTLFTLVFLLGWSRLTVIHGCQEWCPPKMSGVSGTRVKHLDGP